MPFLQNLYASRTLRQERKIVTEPSHPGHNVFESLPSRRKLQSIKTKTSHHKNSFFLTAAGLINTQTLIPCEPCGLLNNGAVFSRFLSHRVMFIDWNIIKLILGLLHLPIMQCFGGVPGTVALNLVLFGLVVFGLSLVHITCS